MRTLKQILSEFWLPLLAAICWTAYVLWSKPIDLKAVISGFGPAFFLASWMTGQFFRIRKQEKVQSGLSSVETLLAPIQY